MGALIFLTMSAALALSLPMAGTVAAGCDPAGEIRFVCGQAGPENLVAVPGTAWLIASAFGADGGVNPASDVVSFATVAVQIGKELWVGSSRGDRIARYPATGLRQPQ